MYWIANSIVLTRVLVLELCQLKINWPLLFNKTIRIRFLILKNILKFSNGRYVQNWLIVTVKLYNIYVHMCIVYINNIKS